MIDILFVQEYLPLFLKGTLAAMQIALFSCFIGTILGLLLGIVLAYKVPVLQHIVWLYVIIVRGTPMLIQIMATYFLLTSSGFCISAFWSAVVSIGFNSGAYLSQVVVSGINSVGIGQTEAAKTLGFSSAQTMYYIVLPQAIRTVLPALGNELTTLIKDSSLASTIGVYELTKQGQIIMSQTYNAPAVFMMVGMIYFMITSVISFVVSYLEKRMQYYVKH